MATVTKVLEGVVFLGGFQIPKAVDSTKEALNRGMLLQKINDEKASIVCYIKSLKDHDGTEQLFVFESMEAAETNDFNYAFGCLLFEKTFANEYLAENKDRFFVEKEDMKKLLTANGDIAKVVFDERFGRYAFGKLLI